MRASLHRRNGTNFRNVYRSNSSCSRRDHTLGIASDSFCRLLHILHTPKTFTGGDKHAEIVVVCSRARNAGHGRDRRCSLRIWGDAEWGLLSLSRLHSRLIAPCPKTPRIVTDPQAFSTMRSLSAKESASTHGGAGWSAVHARRAWAPHARSKPVVYISRLPTGAFKSCLPRSTLTLNTTVTTLVHGDTPSTRDDNRGDSKCH